MFPRVSNKEVKNEAGMSALVLAVKIKHAEMLDFLLRVGLDIESQNNVNSLSNFLMKMLLNVDWADRVVSSLLCWFLGGSTDAMGKGSGRGPLRYTWLDSINDWGIARAFRPRRIPSTDL